MYHPLRVFRFVEDAQGAGRKVALVTIVGTTGASARRPGTLFAVSEDGRYEGSLTGGCIEAAVAAEAQKALAGTRPHEVRFGEGSPYMDVRLPCGGGLDLLFNPLVDPAFGACIKRLLERRRAVRVSLPRRDGAVRVAPDTDEYRFGLGADAAALSLLPPLQIALFGRGEAMERLRDLSLAIDAEPCLFSPDAALLERSVEAGAKAALLVSANHPPPINLDRFAAAVLLFHDHDWEPPILAQVLQSDTFFIGAMGSRAAQAVRAAALRRLGVGDADIAAHRGAGRPHALHARPRDPCRFGAR